VEPTAPLGSGTLNVEWEQVSWKVFFRWGREAVPDSMTLCLQVALQFPDQLLGDAGAVAARLEETTGSKMFILGDTAYGRCERGLTWLRPGDPGLMVFLCYGSVFLQGLCFPDNDVEHDDSFPDTSFPP
jgi:hypothetical protein